MNARTCPTLFVSRPTWASQVVHSQFNGSVLGVELRQALWQPVDGQRVGDRDADPSHPVTGTLALHGKGTGEAASTLLAGTVNAALLDVQTLVPLVTAGRLRSIAVTGSWRLSTMPDLPTVAEAAPAFADVDPALGTESSPQAAPPMPFPNGSRPRSSDGALR